MNNNIVFLKHRNGLLIVGKLDSSDQGNIVLYMPYVYNTKLNELSPLYSNLNSKKVSIPLYAIDIIFHDSDIIDRYNQEILEDHQKDIDVNIKDDVLRVMNIAKSILELDDVINKKWLDLTRNVDLLYAKVEKYQGKDAITCLSNDNQFFSLFRAFVDIKAESKRIAEEKMKQNKEVL